jgi:cephalosporin-C deacetylase-like acetyl esterase
VKTATALVCAALLGASAAGASTAPPFNTLKALYAYDASRPASYRDAGVTDDSDGIAVHDVSFLSPRGGRVTGYLVLPARGAPAPLILWSPGLGGNRYSQLEDARALAKRGAAGFLIDPPSARPGGRDIFCSGRDRNAYIQQVVDLRRAIDVLGALPEIDRTRIAQVGFSWGSSIAGTLAGVEPRIRASVIDSGRAYHSHFLRDFCKPQLGRAKLASYAALLSVVDPVRYVAHATPNALLLQSGRLDPGTPRSEVLALYAAARQPKQLRWYAGGHELTANAYRERADWLVARLR